MVENAARMSRMKQREELRRSNQEMEQNDAKTKFSGSLTITHVQGLLVLLLLGLIMGIIILGVEKIMAVSKTQYYE